MRPSPGRLFWLLLVSTLLWSAPYRWSVTLGNDHPWLHQAVELRYTCRFDDANELYSIDFNPPPQTEQYRLILLGERERIESGRRVNDYRYLLFPLQAGELKLSLSALMRKTTRDSIENTVIGRDNVEDLDFTDTEVALPAAVMQVAPQSAQLAGHYTMELDVSARKAAAYEPVHLTLRISGTGNLDRLEPYSLELPGVQVFGEAPEADFKSAPKGFEGSWVQRFALVGTVSFEIPPFTLEYFDTESEKLTTLSTPTERIDITPPPPVASLLDPEAEEVSAPLWKMEYLWGLLIFAAGVATGYFLRRRPRREEAVTDFAARVEKAATPRALAMVLALEDARRYRELIEGLESGRLSLSAAKKQLR